MKYIKIILLTFILTGCSITQKYNEYSVRVNTINVSDLKIKISRKNFTTKEDEKSYIQDLLKESNREQNLGDLLDDN